MYRYDSEGSPTNGAAKPGSNGPEGSPTNGAAKPGSNDPEGSPTNAVETFTFQGSIFSRNVQSACRTWASTPPGLGICIRRYMSTRFS